MASASTGGQGGRRFPNGPVIQNMNEPHAVVVRGDRHVSPPKPRPSAAFMRKNSLRLYAMPENNRTRTGRPCFDDLALVEDDDNDESEKTTQKIQPPVRVDLRRPTKKMEPEDEEAGMSNDEDKLACSDRPRRKSQLRCGMIAGTILVLLWIGWFIWLSFFVSSLVWPLPRGLLNRTDGVAVVCDIINKGIGALVTAVGLFLVIFVARSVIAVLPHTAHDASARSVSTLAACTIGTLAIWTLCMGVGPYLLLLHWMRAEAYSRTCESMPVTAHLIGSSIGIVTNWDSHNIHNAVRAELFRTSDGTPLSTWYLTKPGNATLVFTPADERAKPASQSGHDTVDGKPWQITYDLKTFSASTPDGYVTRFTNNTFLDHIELYGPVVDGQQGDGWSSMIGREQEVMLHPPDFRLRRNAGGGDVVLRSVALDAGSCQKLKVCGVGWDHKNDLEAALESLVPMGLALYYQALWAFSC